MTNLKRDHGISKLDTNPDTNPDTNTVAETLTNMPMKENVIKLTGEAKGLSLKAQRASESEPAAGLGDVLVPVAKVHLLGGPPGGHGEKAFRHGQDRRLSPAAPHGRRG